MLTACAPTAAPAVVPRLKPPLDSLAFYVGSWQCKGVSYGKADEHWDATIEVAPELGGAWVSVKMTGPGDNHTIEHKGYNPESKRWTHVAVVNDGGWAVMSSPGWTGNQMVFTPEDKTDTTHATFTKLGERSYSHAVAQADGKKVWEKVCTKS